MLALVLGLPDLAGKGFGGVYAVRGPGDSYRITPLTLVGSGVDSADEIFIGLLLDPPPTAGLGR